MTVVNEPVGKPHIRLRVESDNWAMLFDPDTGNYRVINPKIQTIFHLEFEDWYIHRSVETWKTH